MRTTTKNIIRVAGVAVSLGAAAWALRDRLLPAPEVHHEPPPRFRTAPAAEGGPGPDADVMDIRGIGPASAAKLNAVGITTVHDLAAADAAELAEATGLSHTSLGKWIEAAGAAG